RFSHDKTPYKTNVGIQFRHFQGKDVHAPGLYLHIANDGCFIAAGMWHPPSPDLNAIRSCIDENPNAYKKALQTLQHHGFDMAGDSLIRPPKGFDKHHPLLSELKRKDFIAVKPLDFNTLCESNAAEHCAAQFSHCLALMSYLCFALDLDFGANV
ncbi:MAG: TIGR02453 family protein, partial [Shewanella sp.]